MRMASYRFTMICLLSKAHLAFALEYIVYFLRPLMPVQLSNTAGLDQRFRHADILDWR